LRQSIRKKETHKNKGAMMILFEIFDIIVNVLFIIDGLFALYELTRMMLHRKRRLFTLKLFFLNFLIVTFGMTMVALYLGINISRFFTFNILLAVFLTFVVSLFTTEKLRLRLEYVRNLRAVKVKTKNKH